MREIIYFMEVFIMNLLGWVLLVYLVLSIIVGVAGLIYWWPVYKNLRKMMIEETEENKEI
jgi:hypothetical protein